MIFNRWRRFKLDKPRTHPKKAGRYLCTVRFGDTDPQFRVMDLYYDHIVGGVWQDDRRQSVFSGYKVYLSGRVTSDDTRVVADMACDKTLGVVAWKYLPAPYKRGR